MNTKPATAAAIRQFILARYAEQLAACGHSTESIRDDFDLLQESVIDSLGILEMVSAVETEFDATIDLEAIDADDLTKIGPFCRYAADAIRTTLGS